MEEKLKSKIEEAGRGLTLQQKTFVREYMIDFCGSSAAIRAGYSEKGASATACRLLRNEKIKAYRDALAEERFEAIGVTRANIAAELWEIYKKCSEKVPVLEWDSNAKEWKESGVWQFNAKGAMKALEMLSKLLGFDAPVKIETVGGIESLLAQLGGGKAY